MPRRASAASRITRPARVDVDGRLDIPPRAHARLRFRLPAGERLVRVLIGKTSVTADRAGTIDLGSRPGTIELRAVVR